MYKKGSKGWLKHFDFILLDMICLQIAFLLAYVIRHDSGSPYIVPLYRNMAIFMELLDIIVMFFYETLSNVLKRGYFREFAVTVKHVLLVELFSVLYLFTMQEGQAYSRTALYLTGVIYAILTYIVRIIWKKILRSRMSEGNRSLLVVTTKDMAEQVVHNIRENNYERFALSGLVIIDDDLCGTKIAGVPVVANEENAAAYVCREWIDEVFVIPATDVPYPYALMEQFAEAGVTVHLNLAKVSEAMGGKKQLVEKVGPYTVLTTSINYASTKQLFMKRAIDIAGGLLGCLLTLLITLFVGPAIYLKSPGPIFFAQERVGKNGKKFKMYKFRSMYMDAEERKAELMKQNRVSDGMMFKLDFDPRVIGNEILPDGTKKTGIGNFIRVTSLDEFPQFFNVLKGDMSIVGTRPPTLDEWNKYELHHRARLAIKPGITGMPMGKVDTVTKAYMRKNNIFADAFNYLVYDGKPVVNPEQLRELDTTEIALPFGLRENEKGPSNDLVQKYRDILKSAVVMQEDEAAYILLGIENQTDIHSDGTLTDELTYEVTHNDSSILSILFDRYLYLGGAHGTPLRKSMVVNLNTGEPIKLHEILPVSFSELMDILRNQLYVRYGSEDTEVLEVCYKNIVDLYHEVDEFKFYIRYSALYIYFDVYEISSYSMGYVDLYIMDLQEFLSERCDISECDIVRKQAIFEKIFKPNIR